MTTRSFSFLIPLLYHCREKEEWKLRALLLILLHWAGCRKVSCNFFKETIPIDITKCCDFAKVVKSSLCHHSLNWFSSFHRQMLWSRVGSIFLLLDRNTDTWFSYFYDSSQKSFFKYCKNGFVSITSYSVTVVAVN